MSDWTIKLPLGEGEMLHVDLNGLKIQGYRVVSDDMDMPQTVLPGIEEAIDFVRVGLADSERLEILANVAASVSDEIKAKKVASPYQFPQVSCSNCGGAFGPWDHGFSHCENHERAQKEHGLKRLS